MSTLIQRQFLELKKQNSDSILFFRLGDFYEMFYEDAQLASRILGITLTARHKNTENEMPMCGVPARASTEYLEKLVESGYKVAIAEQIEDSVTGFISRKVVRVVTPGTSMEKGTLTPEKNNFLVAIIRSEENTKKNTKFSYGISVSDISTGEFRTAIFDTEISFFDELYKLNPAEILITSDLFSDEKFCIKLPKSHITPRKNLEVQNAKTALQEHFGLKNLEVFGLEKISLLIQVSAMLLNYLKETQKSDISHIQKITKYSVSDIMPLDAQTFRHLEIFQPIFEDENSATLLSVFEKTCTAIGGRTLRSFLINPLINAKKITDRLEGNEELFNNFELSEQLETNLKQIADLQRILARLVTNRGNGRDLAFFRDSFKVLPNLSTICQFAKSKFLRIHADNFIGLEEITNVLQKALVDNPPLEITAGGIFRDGFYSQLDELRTLTKNSQLWLDKFLEEKKEESGINNIKIKYSKNFGFCLEVSKLNIPKVPESWIRRQTLTNAERYTTEELAEYEEKALSAENKSFELEHELFLRLRKKILAHTNQIQKISKSIGELDVLLTFAKTAQRWRWTKPEIMQENKIFHIEEGRHPVVEKLSDTRFVSNDCFMNDENSRVHLITGPNMAGKSTFLRQNALIIFLGQIGSFVPAKAAQFGIVDRIFTRVGSGDNLAGGKSTFFVEMTETAAILNAATQKSFIILDEIGRGTSTFDGISLAWAITEFLHDKAKCKTLFATHYHELIDLAEKLSAAKNFHVSVSQNQDGIVFLRKIQKGGISDSFGIDVAATAGLPQKIISEARNILSKLESENLLSNDQPNLFSHFQLQQKNLENKKNCEEKIENKKIITEKEQKILEIVKKIDPNDLSPRDALEIIFDIKNC